jgi:maltose alpha-D-glucosyltransferase / alpha-amylase
MATATSVTASEINVVTAGSAPEIRKAGRVALQPLWYKDAIIYQLHVRAFRDSNRDGIGDFPGLTESLNYIQDLGVTAIWLLPFFPSPLKDDGYDIADYENVNPQYGTRDDFQRFLEEAHRRELRIITELVMNHTSDQHAWFQRARQAPAGSALRDWYVWSDTPERYQEARIIFQDFESSNWSWDPLAGAYFWHRFYNHQPDLNFDNADVRAGMLETLDFWFQMGVDGLRLDAVPYLFEREGTNCENLPETHAFLREVRARIDDKFQDKMLLAEANQWPEDAAAYFGDGDECHMNFHFPLMPRLFMAVEREDQSPIVDILDQTPLLPQSCQWAIFLRNHDELTLEMVTDEERDYMYRTYAVDAKARINLGIRRRLAPLMGNDRRKIELMNSLLLSLPGTPVLYYGDEIGMGDNYYLGDRNGVRTPMQWNADRSAGFSRANPQSLYLPVIIDPEYHYELRNVDVESSNPHSLLWWSRRILGVRKQYEAFGHGSFSPLAVENSKVFAFLRETDDERLLIVANLSRFSQHVELDLSRFQGRTPMEMFGRASFPVITDRPYQLTLGPHGFYWLCLDCRDSQSEERAADEIPVVDGAGGWKDLLDGRFRKHLRDALEPYLKRHRWFAGKARGLHGVQIIDALDLGAADVEGGFPTLLLLISAVYAHGEPETYVVPAALLDDNQADALLSEHPHAGILRVEPGNSRPARTLCEVTWRPEVWNYLAESMRRSREIVGRHGKLAGVATRALDDLWDETVLEQRAVVHGGEQSNTSARLGDGLTLKLFRRVTPGVNPDLEVGRQLTEHPTGAPIPRVCGAVEYRADSGHVMTVAILHEYVENVSDAWIYTLDELGRFAERVQAAASEHGITGARNESSAPLVKRWHELRHESPTALAEATVGPYLSSAEQLGRRTAELHLALARASKDTAFAPEPFTRLYQRGLYQSMRSQARATLKLLASQLGALPAAAQDPAREMLANERQILAQFGGLLTDRIEAARIRCHGDYHLGQVLFTGKDFVIIDFEGEPERPVSERRIKASPLRDVAGMLRSFHYVAHAGMRGRAPSLVSDHSEASREAWAEYWTSWASAAFLKTYLPIAAAGGFLPRNELQLNVLLNAYLMEKALYELRYELNNRPAWVTIPLAGIRQLLA